jgi:hypothetical protein
VPLDLLDGEGSQGAQVALELGVGPREGLQESGEHLVGLCRRTAGSQGVWWEPLGKVVGEGSQPLTWPHGELIPSRVPLAAWTTAWNSLSS